MFEKLVIVLCIKATLTETIQYPGMNYDRQASSGFYQPVTLLSSATFGNAFGNVNKVVSGMSGIRTPQNWYPAHVTSANVYPGNNHQYPLGYLHLQPRYSLNRYEDFLNPQLNSIIKAFRPSYSALMFQQPQAHNQGEIVGQVNKPINKVNAPANNQHNEDIAIGFGSVTKKPDDRIKENDSIDDYDIDVRSDTT